MLTGMNTEIEYKGKVYHVQTEDGGSSHPVVTTLLFKEGAIFLSRKTHYADREEKDRSPEAVKALMKEQHKMVLKELVGGRIPLPSGREA